MNESDLTWNAYSELCHRPDIFTRWMLETTLEFLSNVARLLDADGAEADRLGGGYRGNPKRKLAHTDHQRIYEAVILLRQTLQQPPHPKPASHLSDSRVDMFTLALPEEHARVIHDLLQRPEARKWLFERKLGGYAPAWAEYVTFLNESDARDE